VFSSHVFPPSPRRSLRRLLIALSVFALAFLATLGVSLYHLAITPPLSLTAVTVTVSDADQTIRLLLDTKDTTDHPFAGVTLADITCTVTSTLPNFHPATPTTLLTLAVTPLTIPTVTTEPTAATLGNLNIPAIRTLPIAATNTTLEVTCYATATVSTCAERSPRLYIS